HILALRVVRARDELAVRSLSHDERRAIDRASLFERHRSRSYRSGLLTDLADVATFGITGAAQERPVSPALERHRATAEFASLILERSRLAVFSLFARTRARQFARRAALGVVRTGEELAEAAQFDDHRRAALFTHLIGRDGLPFG